jgi:hypothetical protein
MDPCVCGAAPCAAANRAGSVSDLVWLFFRGLPMGPPAIFKRHFKGVATELGILRRNLTS